MFKVNAYVTEIEEDTSYEVDIVYGDCDFDFVCRSYKGGKCRSYVVTIDDGE